MRSKRSLRALVLGTSVVLAAVACRRKEPAAPVDPAKGPAKSVVGVGLGEPIEGFEQGLRDALRERELDVVVEASHGHAAAQLDQVGKLLDRGVSLLVLCPVVPDVLHRSLTLAELKGVPMLSVLRGDGLTGSWVGVSSTTLAREAGKRAGSWLKGKGKARPRIFVIEDARWPEARRRAEETIRGIEEECGSVDVPLRVVTLPTSAETTRVLLDYFRRIDPPDVLVAGDRFATAAGVETRAKCGLASAPIVVGATDDEKLLEAARAPESGLLFVAWKRSDVVARVVDEIAAGLSSASSQTVQKARKSEVPCEIVGLEAEEPPKDGS